jgi:hypothetical protein
MKHLNEGVKVAKNNSSSSPKDANKVKSSQEYDTIRRANKANKKRHAPRKGGATSGSLQNLLTYSSHKTAEQQQNTENTARLARVAAHTTHSLVQ